MGYGMKWLERIDQLRWVVSSLGMKVRVDMMNGHVNGWGVAWTNGSSGGTTGVQTVRRTGVHGPRGPIQTPYY